MAIAGSLAKKIRRRITQPAAVSLFSGAGGFCDGVRLAGYDVLCAVEENEDACATHKANFPNVSLFEGSIRRFLVKQKAGVPTAKQLTARGVDLVYGGPPCQGFSQIGPRDLRDSRNLLYKEFVRVVQTLAPRAFIMENVPNIVAIRNGHYRELILSAFVKAGYSSTSILHVTASDFGVPQDRHRVFFIGLRDGESFTGPLIDEITKRLDKYKCKQPVTVRDAISDLPCAVSKSDCPLPYPKLGNGRPRDYQRLMRMDLDSPLVRDEWNVGRGELRLLLHNHHTKGMESRRKKIVRAIKPGMRGDSLPSKLWDGKRAHKWRRLDPDRPSYTILAQMHRDLSEWIHHEHHRWITVREAARLQSFHDGFVFCGSEYQQLKQVGNAVPPLLGFAVASTIKEILTSEADHRRSRS